MSMHQRIGLRNYLSQLKFVLKLRNGLTSLLGILLHCESGLQSESQSEEQKLYIIQTHLMILHIEKKIQLMHSLLIIIAVIPV